MIDERRSALRADTKIILTHLTQQGWVVSDAPHPSEEAEVWSLRRGTSERCWLKAHLTTAKASREVEVYQLLAQHPNELRALSAPRLIEQVGSRHLLLSHLKGQPLYTEELSGAERTRRARALSGALSALHRLSLPGAPDSMPLSQALPKRWRASLSSSDGVPSSAPALTLALAELSALAEELEVDESLGAVIGDRCLCHRDLSPDNLRWTPEGRVGLIDFGQARMDWWGSDWVSLWPSLSEGGLFGEALSQHIAQQGLKGRRVDVSRLLRVASLSHALSTLSWGGRHGQIAVKARGQEALSAVLTRWDQREAW